MYSKTFLQSEILIDAVSLELREKSFDGWSVTIDVEILMLQSAII